MRNANAQNSHKNTLPCPLESAPPPPMYCPMAELNPRRNHTFITSKRSWEPTMRHQLRNTCEVAFEAPMEKARGDV